MPEICAAGLKVAVIKHDGHDFEADVPGTDSYRHLLPEPMVWLSILHRK